MSLNQDEAQIQDQNEPIEKEKPLKESIFRQVTFQLIWTVTMVNLSSFFFGYQLGVLNSPKDAIIKCSILPGRFFQDCIPMSDFQWDVVNGIFTIGGLFGALGSGKFADYIGRRYSVHVTNTFLIIGSCFCCIFSNFYVFILGRFLCGVASGAITCVAPMYLAEISPTHLRGFIGNLFEFSNAFAIGVSQVLGIPLSNAIGWRILIGLQVIMSILHSILHLFSLESPRWLYQVNNTDEGEITLQKLRGGEKPVEEIESYKEKQAEFVWRKTLIKPLLIGIGLHLSQQFSGINLIIFYSTSIFNSIGMQNPAISTAIIGVACTVTTFIVGFIIEKLGRRPLLIFGEIIQMISLVTLALSFIFNYSSPFYMGLGSVVSMIIYIVAFSFSLGPVTWVMSGELFPNDARATLLSIVVVINWFSQFLVLVTFSTLQSLLKNYTFLLYAGFVGIAIIFAIFCVPETKNKSIEEITGGY